MYSFTGVIHALYYSVFLIVCNDRRSNSHSGAGWRLCSKHVVWFHCGESSALWAHAAVILSFSDHDHVVRWWGFPYCTFSQWKHQTFPHLSFRLKLQCSNITLLIKQKKWPGKGTFIPLCTGCRFLKLEHGNLISQRWTSVALAVLGSVVPPPGHCQH